MDHDLTDLIAEGATELAAEDLAFAESALPLSLEVLPPWQDTETNAETP